MHEVRNMKDRIESERKRAGHDLEMNLKEGPGGIRDVEFLTQWLQLFHGPSKELDHYKKARHEALISFASRS